MYICDGLSEDSSSCKYVESDRGGIGIEDGNGDGRGCREDDTFRGLFWSVLEYVLDLRWSCDVAAFGLLMLAGVDRALGTRGLVADEPGSTASLSDPTSMDKLRGLLGSGARS